MKFLNAKRLRVYPRLMFLTTWTIMGLNLLLRQGWQGGLGQIIGIDYLLFYSTGMIYRSNPANIYDFAVQSAMQQSLIHPTPLPAVNPYFNPPYVAFAHSLLTYLSLPWSLLIWSILTLLFVIGSAYLLMQIIPKKVRDSGMTLGQLIIIMLSFFPFIEGFQAGQNHGLSLLLITGITVSTLSKRWYLAGALAGLMLFKPQYILGFLILWFIWREFRALVSFTIVAGIWVGSFLLLHGIDLYQKYLVVSSILLQLPYDKGFPGYLLVTIYGLLTTTLPQTAWPIIHRTTQIILLVLGMILAWFALRIRQRSLEERVPALVLALIYPLLATPYALLHDMIILIPGFVLWSRQDTSRRLLYIVTLVYLGTFFLPLVAYQLRIALMALIPIGLLFEQIRWIAFNRTKLFRGKQENA